MSDSNIKASEFIDKIELYYDNLLQKLYTYEEMLTQARLEAQTALTQAQEVQINHIIPKETTKATEQNILETIVHITNEIKNDIDDTVNNDKEILELQEQIQNLQSQNQILEEKYKKTYQSLQKEMLKVDIMQMELELLQRERDIALRKQSLSPEQKQLLVKLEYENYKINEAIERIDYISETLRKIIGETPNDAPCGNDKNEHLNIHESQA